MRAFSIKLIILGIFAGLLMTAQWKTPQVKSTNPVATFAALRDTNRALTNEQSLLKDQIANLRTGINTVTRQSKQNKEIRTLSDKSDALKKSAGLTDMVGSGLVIKLDDAGENLGTPDNITHAADLRDIVNILWKNEAQAISINGERVVANTSIDCIVNTILINSTKTTAPFAIRVIGDQKRLSDALYDNNNLPDIWRRVSENGVVFQISKQKNVSILAFTGTFNIKWSRNNK